jgi:hypothetical protein
MRIANGPELMRLLEGVTAYVSARPDWWYAQLQAAADPRHEADLAGWYELALHASVPEQAHEALRQFRALVERGSLAWPRDVEGSFESVVAEAIDAVVDDGEGSRRG